ncbi:MAG: hypothetical protein N4A38_01955 [Candidatus Gracilibacteria bacterium]|nr:hypothetical protein [Candidatus Gracilibacteria bacterium]
MKQVIFSLNLISVLIAVFVASPFIVSGIVSSIGGPKYPFEPFYVDFGLLFLHLFYILFLVIGVLYSLNSYKKDVKKGLIFAVLPYFYGGFLFFLYCYNG